MCPQDTLRKQESVSYLGVCLKEAICDDLENVSSFVKEEKERRKKNLYFTGITTLKQKERNSNGGQFGTSQPCGKGESAIKSLLPSVLDCRCGLLTTGFSGPLFLFCKRSQGSNELLANIS